MQRKTKEWKLKNPERVKSVESLWRQVNADYIREARREYLERNRDKILETYRVWRAKNCGQLKNKYAAWKKKNPAINRFHSNAYRAAKLKAKPNWANDFYISEAYDLSLLRSSVTGVKWVVDHIVPLKNKRVCGLHVEHNLQVITAKHNSSKSNRYEVEA
jgi:hypothetical protein